MRCACVGTLRGESPYWKLEFSCSKHELWRRSCPQKRAGDPVATSRAVRRWERTLSDLTKALSAVCLGLVLLKVLEFLHECPFPGDRGSNSQLRSCVGVDCGRRRKPSTERCRLCGVPGHFCLRRLLELEETVASLLAWNWRLASSWLRMSCSEVVVNSDAACGSDRPRRVETHNFVKEKSRPNLYNWVNIAVNPDRFFGFKATATDVNRLLTDSAEDAFSFINDGFRKRQRVGCLGASAQQFYITLLKKGSTTREDIDCEPSAFLFRCWDEVQRAFRSEQNCRTFTHLASLGDNIVAVAEPLYPGEECKLFNHTGNLTANTLHEPMGRRSMGLLAGTYFAKEKRWIFVFSNKAPIEEKWSVGPVLDRSFIQRGFDEGYCIRKILASPTQWFNLMQRNDLICAARQSILYTMTSTIDFELRMWENKFVMMSASGNVPRKESQSAPSSSD